MDAPPTLVANASHGGNGSEHGLPDALLDTLSPLLGLQLNPLIKLFALLHKVTERHLGIDPTYVLVSVVFVWAAMKVSEQLYTAIHTLSREHFTASIAISSTDDIYAYMMQFFASVPEITESRFLVAETPPKGAWDKEDDPDLATVPVSPEGYFDFSQHGAKDPPRFTPRGLHSFWFNGRSFSLQRTRDTLANAAAGAEGMPQDKETLVISCPGRSPEPIKRLLQQAKEMYYLGHGTNTIVRRPSQRGPLFGSGSFWQRAVIRPIRPLKTVVLDDRLKKEILSDMNGYLGPDAPKWYADRGIPLRRGYLFHGPPGTGKSSLSFALAGVFGLDIYVVSLLNPKLTDETLLALFISLPRRCVVLLEDIDTAGVKRPITSTAGTTSSSSPTDGENEPEKEQDEDKKSRQHERKDDRQISDLARQLKHDGNGDGSGGGISLAGLLNAIDGVATQEGRLLIMTTNDPKLLDDALTRPGRVDRTVGFANATSDQAKELFTYMYQSKDDATPGLPELAMQFSSHIPGGMFSPAQLQGYLLTHKNMPEQAVEGVEAWVKAMQQQ